MNSLQQQIRDNLARIQTHIGEAAAKAGRKPDEIRLIGVTKYVDASMTGEVFHAGCHALGESRPQSLWEKAEQLSGSCAGVQWHLIGHLQRNKIRRTLPHVAWIHSGDSERLLQALDEEAGRLLELGTLKQAPRVLLEVNISGDANKHGFDPSVVGALLERLPDWTHLHFAGLMGMASLDGGREQAQRDFARLRELQTVWQAQCPDGITLDELSMGMSGDYDLAIVEGATMVRVGSAIFEGIDR